MNLNLCETAIKQENSDINKHQNLLLYSNYYFILIVLQFSYETRSPERLALDLVAIQQLELMK